jgi:AcrR family transcriptional regulator
MANDRPKGERVSTPSRRRPYRLGARAEAQAATRRRIAQAAVELHSSIGPARTTIRAIAERAGVERVTVYRHFPDERALYGACSSRFLEDHPLPDLAATMASAQPGTRVEAVLLKLYGYYRQNEPTLTAVLRDAEALPLVAEYVADNLAMLRALADGLAAGRSDAPGRRLLRAAIGHALAFGTWRSLAIEESLTDAEAAAMMARLAQG